MQLRRVHFDASLGDAGGNGMSQPGDRSQRQSPGCDEATDDPKGKTQNRPDHVNGGARDVPRVLLVNSPPHHRFERKPDADAFWRPETDSTGIKASFGHAVPEPNPRGWP